MAHGCGVEFREHYTLGLVKARVYKYDTYVCLLHRHFSSNKMVVKRALIFLKVDPVLKWAPCPAVGRITMMKTKHIL